ncbi:choice-of-anchor B family protein [Mesohalobacter halotolerans]|uniref:Choice-of-anchor B family protein n=1 Tax=Mesohalobacter halotolerans TaxID=1883405 RepID=A0A4U5TPW6_9FLAO|nr:choice-of-anchor B family protein [Mesohalobacter halotolerans]TKS56199.1 choice-of-anchor B family protein [Mesohalobacter halotolerans]
MKNILFYISFVSFLGYGQTPCDNGLAGSFPCNVYNLQSHIDLNTLNAGSGNDSWGWTDPLDGKEYAIMGLNNGTAFIDVSQPTSPIYLGKLPTHTTNSQWRDIKVFGNYAFIVSEASGHGMQVFDLTKLRNVTNPPINFSDDAHYDGFGNAHNIVINESQPYAYAVGTQTFSGGPHVVDISDPLNPVFAGGYASDFYTHDAQVVTYNGPDPDYQGEEIYIGSNEDEVVILNVTDKTNISNISTISYTNIGYTHQAWLTENQQYLLLGDETDELSFGFDTRTIIFDLSDLDLPSVHFDYTGSTSAIDHNGYVKNGLFYLASYTAGLRVIDVSDISNQNLNEIGFFDTFPNNDNIGFSGLWSVYPFFESGNLVLSDINTGFYLVRNSSLSTEIFDQADDIKIYPNPVRTYVNISTSNETIQTLKILSHLGQLVYEKSQINNPNYSIDVSGLSRGLYLMKINDKISKKLIVE